MNSIALNSGLCCDALVIPGTVVDRMITQANEAQLKIYLYLLKMGSNSDITISTLADYFNYTEADVIRALRFWNGTSDKLDSDDNKSAGSVQSSQVSSKGDNVVAFSAKPSYSKDKLMQFSSKPEVAQLLFAAEQYMGRMLTPDDISLMLYVHEEMGFSAELIEYLLEYCISNNKKTAHSMEAVAQEWKELGVVTVNDAKRVTRQIPSVMPDVFDAFGIDRSRQPVNQEITYVRRWTESYGYGMDIIREACQRTVMATGKPSFNYANGILKGWHEAKVNSIADIVMADEQYRISKMSDNVAEAPAAGTFGKKQSSASGAAGSQNNRFKNFTERDYDYESLMKDIMSN